MNRNEEMTRAAAKLIGRDLTGYRWDDKALGMGGPWIGGDNYDEREVFAPLADPCDAFMVEATLMMNVNYRFNGTDVQIAVNSSKKDAASGALYVAMSPIDDADRLLAERMRAIVEFAWMIAVCQKV
jgi:hypothetical protein